MPERRYKKLDNRLTAIAELMREGSYVYDIGTDHAHLPCQLARSGKHKHIYASDLNENPLEFAKKQIEHQGVDVTLLKSNGLLDVPPPPENTLVDIVIAGMGGELIAEILTQMPAEFTKTNLRLILQPMTRAKHLERSLRELGFKIISEKTVSERERSFVIFYVERL